MADTYDGPFATYTNVTGIVNGTAKGEIETLLTNFLDLFNVTPNFAGASYTLQEGTRAGLPDFDKIPRDLQEKMAVEIQALRDAIDAAPVA